MRMKILKILFIHMNLMCVCFFFFFFFSSSKKIKEIRKRKHILTIVYNTPLIYQVHIREMLYITITIGGKKLIKTSIGL
jgi:hypothetical protein